MQKTQVKKLEDAVTSAVEERKDLGLSLPKKCDFYIGLCDIASDGCAVTYKTDAGAAVVVNLLSLFLEQADAQEAKLCLDIADFFDLARDFFSTRHEDTILELIEHPRKTIQVFESSFSKNEFQKYQLGFRERGKPYSQYRTFLAKNAKTVREFLKELKPKILHSFEHANIDDHIRHELDHADFFQTALYKRYDILSKKTMALDEQSKEGVQVGRKLLESVIDVYSLIEPRAYFFSFIPKGTWKDADVGSVKKKVCAQVITNYLEKEYTVSLLDSLITCARSEKYIDTATANYVFHTVYSYYQSTQALQYIVEPEKVNYAVANTLLYEQLPTLKKRIADNIILAVNVIGDSFSQDPSRMVHANKARTFDEFIEIVSRVRL